MTGDDRHLKHLSAVMDLGFGLGFPGGKASRTFPENPPDRAALRRVLSRIEADEVDHRDRGTSEESLRLLDTAEGLARAARIVRDELGEP